MMKVVVMGLVVASSLFCCVEDGNTFDYTEASQEIINGTPSLADEAVVTVRLQNYNAEGYVSGYHICTGTLVTQHIVSTARHCMSRDNKPRRSSDVTIFTGAQPDLFGDNKTDIVAYATHPSADLALLLMEAPIDVVPVPISELSPEEYIGQPVRIVGYGKTTDDKNATAGTKITANSILNGLVERSLGSCLVVGPEPSALCNGDSGGPTFLTIDGVEYLIGVTSHGNGESCEESPGYNVRTDVYYDWIMDYIAENDPGMGLVGENSVPLGDSADPRKEDPEELACSSSQDSSVLWAICLLGLACKRRRYFI